MKTKAHKSNIKIAGFNHLVSVFTALAAALLACHRPAVEAAGQAQLAPAAQANGADEFVEDELLVGFRPGSAAIHADAVRKGLGAVKVKAWAEIDAEHWHLPRGLGVARAIQALSANPNVLYAEPNYILHEDAIPNDPERANMWGLHNVGQSAGTADADIDVFEAWDLSHDATSIVVGVIDTGIDYNHPDLAANIWANPGEMGTDSQGRDKATNGIDDDGNGYVDDVRGWDFLNNDNNPMDDNGHGTHVAGTIGALGDNGIGVAGVAWSVKLMPLKFLGANGSGPAAAAVSAMLYAAKFVDGSNNKKVRITNNSYGSGNKSKTEENAIKSCGALVVAAAGNSASSTPHYPAAYAQPNVIAVAATDRNDALFSLSNFGSWVHLAAPGVDILSTMPTENYDYKSGTSMATPHVAGVAALVLAQNPAWSNTGLKGQLLNTVDVLTSLGGKVSSGGRLNARKALGASEFPPDTTAPPAVTDLAVASAALTSITLSWSAPGVVGVDTPVYFYDLRYSTVPLTDASFSTAIPIATVPQAPGGIETFTVGGLQIARTYYFAIKAYDEAGNASPISNIPSGATLDNDWRFLTVWSGQNLANTVGATRNESGGWSFVADDTGNLKFFNYIAGNGYYNQETVAPISGGASIVYDALWTPTLTYIAAGKLYFAQKLSGAWTISTVESRDILNGDTSSIYDSTGALWTAYPKGGRLAGLSAARKIGTSWTILLVERNGDGIYNQLALAPDDRPSVVYADDVTGDGKADLLKLGHYDGASWSISTVNNVPSGPVSLAYTPDGAAAIASRSGPNNELRFYLSTPSGWFSEVVDPAIVIQSCSIAVHSDGTIWIAYATLSDMRAARRDPATGVWTTMLIDPDGPGTCRTAMYLGSTSGRPLVLYGGPSGVVGYTDGLRYAVKNTP